MVFGCSCGICEAVVVLVVVGIVVVVGLVVVISLVVVVVVVIVELNELAGRESNTCILKSTDKAHVFPENVLIVTLIQKSTFI